MESNNLAGNAVTGNFSINAQMPNGKTISVSGYLYDEESIESVNDRLDLLHDVVDRQRLRAEIPELIAKRDQLIANLNQMKDHMASLEKKQMDEGKLKQQEKLALEQMNTTLGRVLTDIDKGTAAIAEAKLKAGVE